MNCASLIFGHVNVKLKLDFCWRFIETATHKFIGALGWFSSVSRYFLTIYISIYACVYPRFQDKLLVSLFFWDAYESLWMPTREIIIRKNTLYRGTFWGNLGLKCHMRRRWHKFRPNRRKNLTEYAKSHSLIVCGVKCYFLNFRVKMTKWWYF